MGSLLVDVAIYGLAAALAAPIAAVVSALILGVSKRPVASAWTFVAGAAFLDIGFSVVMLASGLLDVSSDASAWIDAGLGVLFLVMGILAVFSSETPEKDEARRARANKVASSNLSALFLAGLAVQIINIDAIAVFTGALKDISRADLSTAGTVFVTAFGLAIMLSVYYAPPAIYSLFPAKASTWLHAMSEWILANSRSLEIYVGIGFGLYFVAKGLVVLV
jgi:threonine/homoserine/homoserine lactone efflux protein